jgi:nitrate/nitrite transporter NarK
MKSGLAVFGVAIVSLVFVAVVTLVGAVAVLCSVLLPFLVIGAIAAMAVAGLTASSRRRPTPSHDAQYWYWYHYQYTPYVYRYYWQQLPVAATAAPPGIRQRRRHSALAAGALRHGTQR